MNLDGAHTQIIPVFAIAITHRLTATLPTATVTATVEGADCVEKPVARVLLPMNGFASARDDHARTQIPRFCRYSCSSVHGKRYGADDAVCMMHKTNELAQIRLAYEIDHTIQRGMPVAFLSALDESDLAAKVVHDRLIILRIPPLGCKIVFAPRHYDPEWFGMVVWLFSNLTHPFAFFRGHVDVASKLCDRDSNAKLLFQVFVKSLNEMYRT
jgi:hypothetical protein